MVLEQNFRQDKSPIASLSLLTSNKFVKIFFSFKYWRTPRYAYTLADMGYQDLQGWYLLGYWSSSGKMLIAFSNAWKRLCLINFL